MQASKGRGFLIERYVALSDGLLEAKSRKLACTEGACEKAAIVCDRLDIHNVEIGERCLYKFQSRTLTRGMGTTNLPPHAAIPDICVTISSRKFHGKMST